MKINAVGVASRDFRKSVGFYEILGFKFPDFKDAEQHLDAIVPDGSTRLMLDSIEIVKDIIGEEPTHGNHSSFAIEYDSADELNSVAVKLSENGYSIVKEPWNAFWGQRYAVVEDPDGYKIDLYSSL
jgi:catechol 2,3-dioxygenase-like lactoylglutathione lyase family enzyme